MDQNLVFDAEPWKKRELKLTALYIWRGRERKCGISNYNKYLYISSLDAVPCSSALKGNVSHELFISGERKGRKGSIGFLKREFIDWVFRGLFMHGGTGREG